MDYAKSYIDCIIVYFCFGISFRSSYCSDAKATKLAQTNSGKG